MRHVTRILVMASLLVCAVASVARAVTVDDLVNLQANGLSDDILVAVIESDGSVFHLSPQDIIVARKRGLSETVLLAMILTGQKAPVAELTGGAAVEPAAETAVLTRPASVMTPYQLAYQDQQPVTTFVTVAIPVAVPVGTLRNVDRPREAPPVYWGFGGARRADSWVPVSEQKTSTPKPDAGAPKRP